MRLSLNVTSGPAKGNGLVLHVGDIRRVGRLQHADFDLADPLVSRAHFSIECAAGGARIRDLGSRNGTLLNGRKVVDEVVRDGDEVTAGDTTLLVEIEAEPGDDRARQPPPPPARPETPPPQMPVHTEPDSRNASDREPMQPASRLEVPPPEPLSPPARARIADADPRPNPTGTITPSSDASLARAALPPSSIRRPYAVALADGDASVRSAALLAAAWAREPWLINHCAGIARKPVAENWDAILLLAILAPADQLETILGLVKATALGPQRFRALGAFGHPGVVPALLRAIAHPEPETAMEAALAFTKITGADVDLGSVAPVATPPSSGPAGAENQPVVTNAAQLPRAERAEQHWKDVKATFAHGTRWCRGVDVSDAVSEATLAAFDLESRWQTCLRGRFTGTWKGSLADLETYPQARTVALRRRA